MQRDESWIDGQRERRCYFCDSPDHIKKYCELFQEWKKEKEAEKLKVGQRFHQMKVNQVKDNGENNEFLFAVSEGGGNGDRWVLDSAASSHISSDKSMFETFDPYHVVKVNVATGVSLTSTGRGTVRMELVNSNGDVSNFSDVLYVPEIQGNFVSVKKLVAKGFTVKFGKHFGEICWNHKQIVIADVVCNFYKMRKKKIVLTGGQAKGFNNFCGSFKKHGNPGKFLGKFFPNKWRIDQRKQEINNNYRKEKS